MRNEKIFLQHNANIIYISNYRSFYFFMQDAIVLNLYITVNT